MDEYEASKSVIGPDDLADGGDFITEFSASLSVFRGRLAGAAEETAAARSIRDRLHAETSAKVKMEAFRAHPHVGRGVFPLLGIWYAFSLVLYYISFAGNRVAGILLTLLALAVFITGFGVLTALFIGNDKLNRLTASKISYNVVSEFGAHPGEHNTNGKTVLITDNHDAVLGSYFQDFGSWRKIAFIFVPVTCFLFVLFCILKAAIGIDTPAKISVFTVLPAINGVLGIFIIITHFSPFEKHARPNNGVATSVALATYAYFVEHPEFLPDGSKIVYASFGSENAVHGGSKAFVAAHPELSDALVLNVGDIQSRRFQVAEYDAVRKIEFSTPVVSIIRSAAFEQGIQCDVVEHKGIKHILNSLHGYQSNAFSKNKIAAATIVAKDYNADSTAEIDRRDAEALFSLTVGTVLKLFNE